MKLKRVKYERKNEVLQKLVDTLFKVSKDNDVKIWKVVAEELLKPARKRVAVNLSDIEKYSKDGEDVLVSGKVLGYGDLSKKITVVAYQFSDSALESIKKNGGKAVLLSEYLKINPKGSNLRLLK